MTGKVIPIKWLRKKGHKGGKQGQKQGELCLQKKENRWRGAELWWKGGGIYTIRPMITKRRGKGSTS